MKISFSNGSWENRFSETVERDEGRDENPGREEGPDMENMSIDFAVSPRQRGVWQRPSRVFLRTVFSLAIHGMGFGSDWLVRCREAHRQLTGPHSTAPQLIRPPVTRLQTALSPSAHQLLFPYACSHFHHISERSYPALISFAFRFITSFFLFFLFFLFFI